MSRIYRAAGVLPHRRAGEMNLDIAIERGGGGGVDEGRGTQCRMLGGRRPEQDRQLAPLSGAHVNSAPGSIRARCSR